MIDTKQIQDGYIEQDHIILTGQFAGLTGLCVRQEVDNLDIEINKVFMETVHVDNVLWTNWLVGLPVIFTGADNSQTTGQFLWSEGATVSLVAGEDRKIVTIAVTKTNLLAVAKQTKAQTEMDYNRQLLVFGPLTGRVIDVRHMVPIKMLQGMEITVTKGRSTGKRFFVWDIDDNGTVQLAGGNKVSLGSTDLIETARKTMNNEQ